MNCFKNAYKNIPLTRSVSQGPFTLRPNARGCPQDSARTSRDAALRNTPQQHASLQWPGRTQ